MYRFLGKKKEEVPKPTLEETNQRLETREDNIQQKINKLDKELSILKGKMKQTKGHAHASYKRKAMDILKRRKMYENQLNHITSQSFNLTQQSFMIDSMKDTAATVDVMKSSVTALKTELKALNINKVENMQDDLEDLKYQYDEVQDVMSRALGMEYEEIDENELDDELEALDDYVAEDLGEDEAEADYLKPTNLPSVPNTEVEHVGTSESLPPVPVKES